MTRTGGAYIPPAKLRMMQVCYSSIVKMLLGGLNLFHDLFV